MNTSSAFPNQIDDLIFFQDITLDNAATLQHYQQLLQNTQYAEAAQFIQESEIPYYGAALFNLMENRIYATQKYFMENPKTSPFVYSATEPADAPEGSFWIG